MVDAKASIYKSTLEILEDTYKLPVIHIKTNPHQYQYQSYILCYFHTFFQKMNRKQPISTQESKDLPHKQKFEQ